MFYSNNIDIRETAFVTSSLRAIHVDISKDICTRLWSYPKTEKWIPGYLKKVSSVETFTHCLNNAYFLEGKI